MKQNVIFFFVIICGVISFVSCMPPDWVPESDACNTHLELHVANETSSGLIVDFWVYNWHSYTDSIWQYQCVQEDLYKVYKEQWTPQYDRWHFLFLIDSAANDKCFITDKRTSYVAKTSEKCNRCLISEFSVWHPVIYNLKDTTSFVLPLWMSDIINLPFVFYQWDYNSEIDTNYTICCLSIDTMVLANMQKDTSMIEMFADFYGK